MQPIPHPATLCAPAALSLSLSFIPPQPANSLHTSTHAHTYKMCLAVRHSFCAIFATLAHTFIVKRTSVTPLSQPEEWRHLLSREYQRDFYLYSAYLGVFNHRCDGSGGYFAVQCIVVVQRRNVVLGAFCKFAKMLQGKKNIKWTFLALLKIFAFHAFQTMSAQKQAALLVITQFLLDFFKTSSKIS